MLLQFNGFSQGEFLIQSELVSKEPIAIIGLGCVLPDAPDVKSFWDNVLAGKSSIREVPTERWDPALFYDTDKSAPDKTIETKITLPAASV